MKKNEIYILNPHYHLRNDTRRILLFSKIRTDERSSNNWYGFIHPLQALMLSFFTYKRSLEDNVQLLSEYFHCKKDEMEHFVMPFIENEDLLSTRWHGQEIVFPKNVLVKASGKDNYLNLRPTDFVCKDLDFQSRRLYDAPLSMTLMLTNRCVTNCCYCYADTQSRFDTNLSTKRIFELIEEAGKLPMKCVNLIGGEVFLHPDWAEILKKTVDCHVESEYISTKMPLTQEIIETLQWTGYKGIVQVSLDALDANVIGSLLKVQSNYVEQIEQGLLLLDKSGLKYQVATVLTTYNADMGILTELYEFLVKLKNIKVWNLIPVHDSLYPKVNDFQLLKPKRELLDEIFNQLDGMSRSSNFEIAFDKGYINKVYNSDKGGSKNFNGTKCPASNTHFFILPDGKVTICEQLYKHPFFIIGDVSKDGLSAVWNSERSLYLAKDIKNDIRPLSRCFQCKLGSECFEYNNRCWADIMKAYGEYNLDYPDPRCEFAGKMKNYIGY